MPRIAPPGTDPYSDDHPRGAFNRSMREKSALAVQLARTQPTGDATAPEVSPGVPVGEATTEQLADAIADAIDRRQHQPTAAEQVREKSRQLLKITRDRDARHIQRARGQNGQTA